MTKLGFKSTFVQLFYLIQTYTKAKIGFELKVAIQELY